MASMDKKKTAAAEATSAVTQPWACRTCGQKRIKSWCMNTKCDEYVGSLHICRVIGCDIQTPHVLCRVHYSKGQHCGTCARRFNEEGFCLKCDTLLECVIDECKGHARWIDETSIPLCSMHWGTRICFEHSVALDGGVCPLCKDSVPCTVVGCNHPTVEGRPLCVAHHKEGRHCACGCEMSGMDQAVMFCTACDEYWKCATKGCKDLIGAYKYCKTCHNERSTYLA